MSKFIRVTEQACGEVRLIPTSSIKEVSVDGNGSVIFYGEGRFYAKESVDQIEAQLLRDGFAKGVMTGMSADEDIERDILSKWSSMVAEWSSMVLEEMSKERRK